VPTFLVEAWAALPSAAPSTSADVRWSRTQAVTRGSLARQLNLYFHIAVSLKRIIFSLNFMQGFAHPLEETKFFINMLTITIITPVVP